MHLVGDTQLGAVVGGVGLGGFQVVPVLEGHRGGGVAVGERDVTELTVAGGGRLEDGDGIAILTEVVVELPGAADTSAAVTVPVEHQHIGALGLDGLAPVVPASRWIGRSAFLAFAVTTVVGVGAVLAGEVDGAVRGIASARALGPAGVNGVGLGQGRALPEFPGSLAFLADGQRGLDLGAHGGVVEALPVHVVGAEEVAIGIHELALAPLGGQEVVVVVIGILNVAEGDLLQVVDAGDGTGLLARLGEGGEQHASQDGDDGDDHQKFNQGERFAHFVNLNYDFREECKNKVMFPKNVVNRSLRIKALPLLMQNLLPLKSI